MRDFPTGIANDAGEAELLQALFQHPGWKVLVEKTEEAKRIATSSLRNPKGNAQESIYNYGYNNGCLDQMDKILNLPDNVQKQITEVKKSE